MKVLKVSNNYFIKGLDTLQAKLYMIHVLDHSIMKDVSKYQDTPATYVCARTLMKDVIGLEYQLRHTLPLRAS